jgi:hypothetical protein
MRFFLLSSSLFLVAACSEYEFNSKDGAGGAWDDTGVIGESGLVGWSACEQIPNLAPNSVAVNTECETTFQAGSFSPTVEWRYGNSDFCGPAVVGAARDTNTSGGLDAGDTPFVFLNQAGRVHAVRGDTGQSAWTSSVVNSSSEFGGMAYGDVTGDGSPDIVSAGGSQVCVMDAASGQIHWCNQNLSGVLDSYGYNYPAIADMNGDGAIEVTVGSVILRGVDGFQLGRGPHGRGAGPYAGTSGTYGTLSIPIDLDGDGQLELVTGNAAYNMDGSVKWYNGGPDGIVAIADFDGDGQGEIVRTGGATIEGLESDGTSQWAVQNGSGGYMAIGSPAIDDLDGDGVPDIVYAAQDKLIAMDWGGAVKWQQAISDSSGAAGPSLFDFEMDGFPEVLYADETQIRFFNGLDGSVKFTSTEHGSVTILETPIVADVDGDDQVEIVVGHCSFGGYSGITVFGDANQSWPPGRKVWNQHGYSITNIGDLGIVPSPTESNWPDYNSFRSGDVGLPPSEYVDLISEVIDVCEDECETGKVYVAARLANRGNVEAPGGIPVAIQAGLGGPILDHTVIGKPIPSGMTSEMVVFEVNASDIEGKLPVVVANLDSSGVSLVYECDDTNNEAAADGAVCTE